MLPENYEKSQTPIRILVVDDQVLFCEGLTSLFNSENEFLVVGSANTVHDAISLAREHRPDIILMDYSMPDGTGLDALQAILHYLPETKVVLLTMFESDEILFAAMRAGAKGYLSKNVTKSDLIANLRGLQRGEKAISRKMMSVLLDEFSKTSYKGEPAPKQMHNHNLHKLSPREVDVLKELANNATNAEIASNLFLSENTVKHHIRNILDKIEVQNRKEAVVFARLHLQEL